MRVSNVRPVKMGIKERVQGRRGLQQGVERWLGGEVGDGEEQIRRERQDMHNDGINKKKGDWFSSLDFSRHQGRCLYMPYC